MSKESLDVESADGYLRYSEREMARRHRELREAMAVDDLAAVLGLHPRRRLRLSGRAIVVVQPNVITPDERAGVQVGKPIHITPDGPEVIQRYPRKFVRCG